MRLSPGATGWWGIAAVVVIYDTWALAGERQTLSAAFRDNLTHPGWRWLVLPLWALTSLHLFGKLPSRYDPFTGYGILLAQLRRQRLTPLDGPITGV